MTDSGDPNSPTGLAGRKEALRRAMREARSSLPPPDRAERAARVEARLLAIPEVVAARCVLLFYAFGSEIPTRVLAARLRTGGRRVLLPYLSGGAMEAAEVGPEDPLVVSGYGPKEPARRVPVDPAEVDLVLTPGLAFDRRGGRLGYGGGHYDRYLARLGGHATRIGIGFEEQVVDEVPAGPEDERVDLVATDRETIDARA
ncbi:MAG TPA: 5-formyltetrahydrofolate cyclo-ligase [Actinomycetota bacterium]|nr:5-formyltetrahydrofolate cyclo-ligase [Actinomycetota bacterium]